MKAARSTQRIGFFSIAAAVSLSLAGVAALPARADSSVAATSAVTDSSRTTFAPLPADAVRTLPATTLDGKPIDLATVPGYRVVYFFSDACPCVRSCEQLSFKPLAEQYQGKVSFYAVTSGGWDLHDDRANFLSLLATHHLPFPVLLDPKHAVADTLGGIAASQAILLSPDNHIIYTGEADDSKDYRDATGKLGKTHSYLADALAEVFAGKPIAVPITKPKGCSIAK